MVMLCTCAMLAVSFPVAVHASPPPLEDVYVSVTGSDTLGDGSAAAPLRTITVGLTRVASLGTVHVLPGVYHTGETFPLVIPARVMLESTDGKWETTIQGDSANSVIRMRHPLEHTGIHGFTITDGSSTYGGGIEMVSDVLDMPESNWPSITECIITGNDSPIGAGGGLFVIGNPGKIVSPLIEDVSIDNNTAVAGGGVCVAANAMAVFQRCEIRANAATDDGGNILLSDSGSMFYSCDIADGSAENGGNITIFGSGTPEFVYTSITGGSATLDGGGLNIAKTTGDVMFRGVRLAENTAARAGGGLKTVSLESLTFASCLIEGNVVTAPGGMGGAMYIYSEENDTLAIDSCTVAGNEAADGDGVMVIDPDGVHSVAVTIRNSVFWHRQKVPGDNTSVEDYYGFHSADDIKSYSIFRHTSTTGTGVIHSDPLFIDAVAGDYHVQTGSPAIDSGTTLPWPSTTDLDLELRPLDGDSSGSAQFDMGCYERAPSVAARLAGDDRYVTACEVADRGFYSSRNAVIASGAGFADALSAAGLAGVLDGPVLLVKKDSVPASVLDMLSDLAVENVVIVGGETVVAPAVVSALTSRGYAVRRVAGPTRYETSAEVAREIMRLEGKAFSQTGFIVRGDSFPDALAVGPLAYAHKAPVLLVRPTALPDAIATVIGEGDIDDVIVAGGAPAVSEGVYNAVNALPTVTSIERVAGSDRYVTATEIAKEGVARGWVSATYVGIATGLNFPDALAGGPAAGNRGGVLLLCKAASLPPAPTAFLAAHRDEVVRADVFGGANVVSAAVQQAVEDALLW